MPLCPRIWARLEVFLTHEQVELDTNLAENAMRPVALGRKNWLHIGAEKAGPKIAAMLSLLATCQRLGISAREYLLAVLPKLGATSTAEVKRLTPQAWLRSRQTATQTDLTSAPPAPMGTPGGYN